MKRKNVLSGYSTKPTKLSQRFKIRTRRSVQPRDWKNKNKLPGKDKCVLLAGWALHCSEPEYVKSEVQYGAWQDGQYYVCRWGLHWGLPGLRATLQPANTPHTNLTLHCTPENNINFILWYIQSQYPCIPTLPYISMNYYLGRRKFGGSNRLNQLL